MESHQHGQRCVDLKVSLFLLIRVRFQTRQPMCDVLEWFRCTQGGAYHHDGLTYGIYMGADCGPRVYIDEEVIITRM